MTTWKQAIIEERMDNAEREYHRLNQCDWRTLTPRDRVLLDAFGWFALEVDEMPEADLPKDGE